MKRQRSKLRLLNRESGISLISVLVALGITGIIATYLSSYSMSMLASVRTVAQAGELEEVRRLIRLKLNCTQTMNRLDRESTTAEQVVALYDRHGHPIFSFDGTLMSVGKWRLKAFHNHDLLGQFRIEAGNSNFTTQDIFAESVPLVCPTST